MSDPEFQFEDPAGAPAYEAGQSSGKSPDARASAFAARRAAGEMTWPEENYYGWLINDKLADLEGLL